MNNILCEINVPHASVEEKLRRRSCVVVVDTVHNTNSGEWPCVVLVGVGAATHDNKYMIVSRARAQVIVLNTIVYNSKGVSNKYLDYILWREHNGVVTKL